MFNGQSKANIWSKLAIPVLPSVGSDNIETPSRPSHETKAASKDKRNITEPQQSHLPSLPLELLTEILNDLLAADEKASIISLAVTCTSLFAAIVPYICADQLRFSAPWAGTELACTGTYLTRLPPPFRKGQLALKSVKDGASGPERMCMARRIHWAMVTQYTDLGEPEAPVSTWEDAVEGLGAIEKARIGGIVSTAKLFPAKQTYHLRNLDTKEYVRCIPGDDGRGYVFNTLTSRRPLCVDDIMLMRISWTSTSIFGVERAAVTRLARGSWAGQRFEIAPEPVSWDRGWKDVTAEIISEADELKRVLKIVARELDWD